MNRIEQIIGRGVRNLSHKDLLFEKRNVEIFMHGTILGNNKEEAADLYVYRVAEYLDQRNPRPRRRTVYRWDRIHLRRNILTRPAPTRRTRNFGA